MLGAIAWAIIAFFRGETVNAVWFVIAAICTYVIGFRFYARLIELKIVRPRDDHATPAEVFENDTDYMPTDRRVLFGHHFAAIAGAGPLVGPVLAMQMGYLPGTIWIIIGAVFAGCAGLPRAVDLQPTTGPLAGSDGPRRTRRRRRRGRHHRDHHDHDDPAGGAGAGGGAGARAEPVGVFSIAMTIPIALFMGVYLRFLRPGRVSEVSAIGVALLLLAVIAGGWVAETSWGASWFGLSAVTLGWCLIIYGFAASLPCGCCSRRATTCRRS